MPHSDHRRATAAPHPHRFSVTEYYRLGAAGLFNDASHVELIEGEIIDMAPIGCLHAGWVDRLARLFFNQTGDEITVRVQNPLHLSHFSEPEPDLALLRPRATPYTEAHPTPEDVLLLVEVADTSIGYDRDRKIPLYARYAIPEVWLLDLNKPELTIYLAPSASGYRTIQRPEKTAAISPSRLPGVSLTLDRDLFG